MRRVLAAGLAGGLLLWCGLAPGAMAQDYVAKSQACVALIRQKQPQSPIRAGATERLCNLPDLGSLAEPTPPVHAWLASGAACTVPLHNGPPEQPPPCGDDATAVTPTAHGLLRIPLSGDRCLHVLPLLMTDETNGFVCNAVKARTACVRSVRRQGNRTVVRLSTKPGAGGIESEIAVPDTIERHLPLLTHNSRGPLFALMPGQYTTLGEERDMPAYLRLVAQKSRAVCTQPGQPCEDQVALHVSRMTQQMLRRAWNPKHLMPRPERDAERIAMMDRARAQIRAPDAEAKRHLLELIVLNEITDSSPFQVLDAVIQNSGMSWGAHQIDIGANGGPEVALFWDTLRTWRRAPGTGNYPLLRRADEYRTCMTQPIRNYFADQLAIYYKGVPDMTKGMRSPLARGIYERHFQTWLGEEVGEITGLGGLFAKSPFARFYYLDVRNQKGPTPADVLRQMGEAMPEAELATCAGVAAGEAALVAYIRNPPVTPVSSFPDVDRRVGNIHRYLKQTLGEQEGRICPP